jgi:glycosyltransferase involved in cell wall biosynthesis
MYNNKKIGVVVPIHNEEKFISKVIDTMPDFVEKIYAVNDASEDKTAEIISDKARQNSKVVVIYRETRGGVGAAVVSGHKRALKDDMDIIAVMAGDGQMDPAFLGSIIGPVAEGKADYVKGDRLSHREHRESMPAFRLIGNLLLTNLTRIASGYWKISDPQDGYTAISAGTLRKLDVDKIEPGFAFENDMLVKLNVAGARVMDVQHRAVYNGQRSKIQYYKFIVSTSWILLRGTAWRIWAKHFRRRSVKPLREVGNEGQ